MDIRKGQIIDGLFRVLQPYFSRGAAGEIHLAQNPKGTKVILKFIRLGGIVTNLEQFKREYQILLKFAHPNVAKVRHFGGHDGNFFIGYEYVEGAPFFSAVMEQKAGQMVPLFIQALEGLQAIHTAGMLHLDIKSSNILVAKDGKVKIIDFGLAQAREKILADKISGTPQYVAPEMALKKEVDSRADIFSLGCLMFRCVAGGRYPFPERETFAKDIQKLQNIISKEGLPRPPSHYGVQVPKYVDEIILKCLERDPSNRFSSARAVINALKTHHPQDYKESPEALGSYLMPEGDRHIGREKEQSKVFASLDQLLGGRQPQPGVFWIAGAEGMGKSHFLRKIKERAEAQAEKISIHYLEFPKDFSFSEGEDQNWLEEWILHLKKRVGENKKPIVVLLDNFEPSGDLLVTVKGLLGIMSQRAKNPQLFKNTMPLMLGMTGKEKSSGVEKVADASIPFAEIALKPFGRKEIEEFLRSAPAFRNKAVPSEWLEMLLSQTGGSPKELAALLRKRDSHGVLFDLKGKVLVAHAEDVSIDVMDDKEVPGVSKKRLSGLMAGLSQLEEMCLQWMAVWSWMDRVPAITFEDLQFLTGHDHLLPGLNMLISKRLVTHDSEPPGFGFLKYSFLPQYIYQNLGEARTRPMHRKIFECLQSRYAGNEKFGDGLLFHQANGPLSVPSLRALLHLTKRDLNLEGKISIIKKLLEKTISHLPKTRTRLRVYLLVQWIEACAYAGNYRKATAIYQEALDILGREKNFPITLRVLCTIAILPVWIESGRFDEAQREIAMAMGMIQGGAKNHFEPILMNFKAGLLYKKSYRERTHGEALLKAAKAIYEKSREVESALHPLQKGLVRNNDLGIILQALGENEKAAEELKSKLRQLEKNPNVFIEYSARIALASVFCFLKKYEEALLHARGAMGLAQKTRQGKWIRHAHTVMACIHQEKGKALNINKKEEAKLELEKAMKENDCSLAAIACLENRQEMETASVSVLIRKGQCYQELGDFQSALVHFEAAAHYHTSQLNRCKIYLGLGECCVEERKILEAKNYLKNVKEELETLSKPHCDNIQFNVLKAETKCLLLENKRDLAIGLLSQMKRLANNDQDLFAEYRNFVGQM